MKKSQQSRKVETCVLYREKCFKCYDFWKASSEFRNFVKQESIIKDFNEAIEEGRYRLVDNVYIFFKDI